MPYLPIDNASAAIELACYVFTIVAALFSWFLTIRS